MKNRIDAFLAARLVRWLDGVRAHALPTVIATLGATVLLAVYTVLTLGINSDNMSLLPADLPSRKAHDAFVEHFPNLEEAMFVVVDAATPELAREATDALVAALAAETSVVDDAYLPGGGAFFEKNGLLYRSVDELDEFADQMARIQPLIAELERDATIANMSTIVRDNLDEVDPAGSDAEDWRLVLDKLSEATVRAWDPYPVAVSWEEVLLRGSALDASTRRTIVVHPVLDYEDILLARRPIQRIRGLAEELGLTPERGVTVRITGNPALNHDEMIGFAFDVGIAGVVCFVLVTLVLFRALRSVRLVVAAVATLIVGLLWTAAFTTAAIGTLNPLSMTFAILVIGLGVDFAIHVCTGYADGLRSGASHAEALRRTAEHVGPALAFCALTTAIGFFVFIPSDYAGVAELGLIAGTGMFIVFGLTMTFLPALLSTWLRVDPRRDLRSPVRFENDVLQRLGRHPAAIRRIALLVGVIAAIVGTGARFDSNVVEMRDPRTESVQAFQDLLTDANTSPWYLNVMLPDVDAAVALGESVSRLPEVDRVVTLASFVPEDQGEKIDVLSDVAFLYEIPAEEPTGGPPSLDEQVDALRALHDFLARPVIAPDGSALGRSMDGLREHLATFLARVERDGDPSSALADLERVLLDPLPDLMARLRTALTAEPIAAADLPPDLLRRMLAADGTARLQIYPTADFSDPDDIDDFVLAVRAATPNMAGVPLNLYTFGQVVGTSFTEALLLAVVIISGLLYVLWRRGSDVLVCMAPLFLGGALTAATNVLLDMRWNFANVIVIPLLFGIGVDSAIHLMQTAREGAARGIDVLATPTARAVYYSAITTTVSFGSLSLAGHNGLQSLGILLTFGLVYNVICVLVVLPALLDWQSRPAGDVRVEEAPPLPASEEAAV